MFDDYFASYGYPRQMQPVQLIRVPGLDAVKAYGMPPNSSIPFFEEDNDVFYVKSTDGAGFPTIQKFNFSPADEPTAAPPRDYITRAEFEELKEMLKNAQQPV